MNDELFRRFVRDLVEDLQQVSGASLEKLFKPLWDKMAGVPVQANGLNLQGAPISGALDALWPDGSGAEASSDKDFRGQGEEAAPRYPPRPQDGAAHPSSADVQHARGRPRSANASGNTACALCGTRLHHRRTRGPGHRRIYRARLPARRCADQTHRANPAQSPADHRAVRSQPAAS